MMTDHKKKYLLRAALLGSVALLLPQDAGAQALNRPDTIEEVTVTARKREERLKDVPDSISVFSATAIEDANIRSIGDVARIVPNLSVSSGEQPGILLINIRGIGQVRNGEAPVAVVVDGVQLNNINQITQGLFDIERIEVLKGPQGAVYGRNAIGGAINIATRQPTNQFAGWVKAGYGTGDDWQVQAVASGPIVADKLLFRVSGSGRSFDGDIWNQTRRQDINNEKAKSGRLLLVATPTDQLRLDLRGSVDSIRGGAAWYTFVPPGTSVNAILPVTADIAGRTERLMRDFSLKAEYDMPGATLTSITSHASTRLFLMEDFDFLPADYISAEQRQSVRTFSQELRLTSNGQGSLRWQAGAYYLKTDQKIDSTVFLRPGASFILAPFPIPAPTAVSATGSTDDNSAYAVFGQLNWKPSDRFELTAALRYDIDDRGTTDRAAIGRPHFDKKFSSLQPKGSATWFVAEDQMIYASIGKGFRSGGFNPSDRIARVYSSETNVNYEIGAKGTFLDRRLSINGAAFFTQVRNRQVYLLDQIASAQVITSPIPRAEIKGVEAELQARPAPGWELSLSGGLQDSEITKYNASFFAGLPAAGDFTGNKLPQVPKYTYAAAIQYSFNPIAELTVRARAEFTGSGGDYFWEIDNRDRRDAIHQINLRLTGEYGRLSVTGFVENLADKKYILDYTAQRFSGAPLGNYSLQSAGLRSGVLVKVQF